MVVITTPSTLTTSNNRTSHLSTPFSQHHINHPIVDGHQRTGGMKHSQSILHQGIHNVPLLPNMTVSCCTSFLCGKGNYVAPDGSVVIILSCCTSFSCGKGNLNGPNPSTYLLNRTGIPRTMTYVGPVDEQYNGAPVNGPSGFYDAHNDEGVMESEDGAVSGNYDNGMWVQE
ncbi:MAG: hypothetical protein M8353_04820 [ANME-2 cluster archaeon]|nr:hypothetical protein [ANME-2 cluster archaeon]